MPRNIKRSVSWLVVTPILIVVGVFFAFTGFDGLLTLVPSPIMLTLMMIFPLISIFYSFKSLRAKESSMAILLLVAGIVIFVLLGFVIVIVHSM